MKNLEIAKIFSEMADLLEMQDVQWKPRAYRTGAKTLEALSEPVEKLDRKALMELPGIGAALADKIVEYCATGKVREYEKMRKLFPEGVDQMMHLMGLGPKKAWRLYKELKIKNLKELEQAAKKGRISKLRGFGPKSEQEILKSIGTYTVGQGRTLLGRALPLAHELVGQLKRLKHVQKIEVAGSLRRRKETVADIDILVISNNAKDVMDTFTILPQVARVLAKGDTKSSVTLHVGMNADVRVLEPKNFGAALQYFTGSKEHNIQMRQLAIKKGCKLNEYGLFKGKKQVAGRTEEEIYQALGLRYVAPELRENHGEIDAAKAGRLPSLITYGSLKGDLHTHSTWTDGQNTPEEMIKAAIAFGHEYVALTDHSRSERIANGMEEKRLRKYIDEVSRLKRKYAGRIKVLVGSEVSILAEGKLDYADELLSKLDWVVASVHSRFKQGKDEMTKRIIAAIQNKRVHAIGHPTGRLINVRDPYQVDLKKVFAAAVERGVAMELNASPVRLDLKDTHVKQAIEQGVKLVISTDAHSTHHLQNIDLGVAQARRGWAETKDVLNTLPWKRFERYLSR